MLRGLIYRHLVLRMLSHYVGEEKFLKGVSIYLKKHLYANSVTKDLWDGIAESSGMFSSRVSAGCPELIRVAGMDVPKVMDNWVKQVSCSPDKFASATQANCVL